MNENPKEDSERSCQHYWIIEPPNGPTSRGICRSCGEEQEFQNVLSDQPEASSRGAQSQP